MVKFGTAPRTKTGIRQTRAVSYQPRKCVRKQNKKENNFSFHRADALTLPNARVFTTCLLVSQLCARLAVYLCLVLSFS